DARVIDAVQRGVGGRQADDLVHQAGHILVHVNAQELQATDGVVADEQAAMDILQAVGRRGWDNDDKNSCTV
ncbi:hypothetical protein H6B10_18035, partial [Gemmiger formicilis]|uniref:hypothetical protein n=1 Tax=Gemmiger formicilis TaxID=745368 RepID=UPI00195D31AC